MTDEQTTQLTQQSQGSANTPAVPVTTGSTNVLIFTGKSKLAKGDLEKAHLEKAI